jgi:asparagine synthase (glutamine-hydrolysing)
MCGITGKVNFHTTPSVAAVEKMAAKLTHRGPDFGAVLSIDECAIFGHRRLAIIDLSANANQPMQDADKRFSLVFNGEIYNFQELRRELQNDGVVFKSRSDTEVLLYAYRKWGTACFVKLNGMFACAIWDSFEKTCVLARDKMGEKPLYYSLLNKELSFASELSALLEDDRIKNRCTVSIPALNHYFALGYILSPITIYKEIHKLEPASYVTYSSRGLSAPVRYWDYSKYFFTRTNEKEPGIVEHLEGLLNDSIQRQLVSDVPVGAFISGGLDSSGIVAMANKLYGGALQTFTVSFDARSYDEARHARYAANFFHTSHNEVTINLKEDPTLIERAIQCYDEPFSDTSLIPMYALSKFAAQKVKVAFSGDGADELFGGYMTYCADALKKRLDVFPLALRKFASRFLYVYAIETPYKMNHGFRLKQFSKGLAREYQFAHYAWRELFSLEQRTAIIGSDHEEELRESDPFLTFKRYYDEVKELDDLSQHLYVDAKTWLADDILVKIDRAAMAHSLETRCPYLDAPLVEYVASIPSNLKRRGSVAKYILKKLYSRYLPKKIVRKQKSGFNAPVKHWLGGKGNEFKMFNLHVFAERKIHVR